MFCPKCGKNIGNSNFCNACSATYYQQQPQQMNNQQKMQQPMQNQSQSKPIQINITQEQLNQLQNGNKKQKKQESELSIASAVLAFFGCTAPIAFILAIIGLCQKTDKKKSGCWFALIFSVFAFIFVPIFTNSLKNEDRDAQVTQDYAQQPAVISKESYIASCSEFDYRTIARTPSEYAGSYYYAEGTILTKSTYDDTTYYKFMIMDDDDFNIVFLFDYRNPNEEDYINLLDGDRIKIYATFNGMIDATNYLNFEQSEVVSLNMKYCELIEE